jgi:hypothetical protein
VSSGASEDSDLQPFVVAADSTGAARRLRAGTVLETVGRIGLAVSLAAMFVSLSALVWVPASGLGSVGDVVGWVVLAGAAIGGGQALLLCGRDLVREGEAAAELRMSLDGAGITWSGAGGGTLPWARIRHVVVTARPDGGRRLQIATDGPLPASAVTAPPPVQYVRRLLGPSRFALDVCVDRLDRPPSTVVGGIRRASAGRFPDAYPAEQFPPALPDDP